MTDTDARRLLAVLAGDGDAAEADRRPAMTGTEYRALIDRATAATEDLESATKFIAEHDLTALEDAIERAESDLSAHGESGRDALDQLRELQSAAVG